MTILSKPKLIAIVPAGGVGQRANSGPILTGQSLPIPKQYRLIKGVSMLRWSVQALLAEPTMTCVYVGVQADDARAAPALEGLERACICLTAGASRALTVLRTLEMVIQQGKAGLQDWVLVHDAARPGLPLSQLRLLVETCRKQGTGGLLAMPATDTVKLAKADYTDNAVVHTERTVPRQRVWMAQTPQMFQAGELVEALSAALADGYEVTDEASAIERSGGHPLLVQGSLSNFKVTWPEDFEQIERFLK